MKPGKPGKAQVTYAYSSAATAPFSNPIFAPNPLLDIISDLPGIPVHSSNWLVTFNLELFYRFGYMPNDRNSFNMTMSGGLGSRGMIPGHPNDWMGIGIYAMFASNKFKDSFLILDAIMEDEVGLEVYYNFAITPWAQIS